MLNQQISVAPSSRQGPLTTDDPSPRRKYVVLMLAACPFPANYGTPGCIKEMSEIMAEMGHEVHILTYPFGDDSPVDFAQVHRIPQIGWSRKVTVGPTLQKPLFDLLMVIEACRLIWKYKCDLIHAHNYEGQMVGICAKLLTWRPLLYNAVNTMSDELPSFNFIRPRFLARWLGSFLDWFVPKFSDHILALTPELEKFLIRSKVPRDRITVVPAGVRLEMFANANPKRFRESMQLGDARIVLFAGTVDQLQRVDILMEAFARLGAEMNDVILLMACPFAQPRMKAVLVEKARSLGIEGRIRWVDSHPLEDLPDYLVMADVAVAARPHAPGHPIKLLNYMGASRPIVVSAGGAKGIRHLENGFVFRDHDVDHCAEGITTLMRDRELANRLARAARQTLQEEFDWRILCRKIVTIYDKITAGKVRS